MSFLGLRKEHIARNTSTAGLELAKVPQIVLLVEDEALVAMVTEEQLRDLGFEVDSAGSAAEAKALVSQGSAYALAVIDVGLPDLRGDELAVRLQALSPNLKIVIASGYDAPTLRLLFPDTRTVSVISKPYSEDDLTAAIRALGFIVEAAAPSIG